MRELDIGTWVGIIALILAVPVGVMSHVLGHHFVAYLERRKLVKSDQTRQQALRTFNRIRSFHHHTRDRYAFYLLLIGVATISAVASSTAILIIVLTGINIETGSPGVILLIFAVFFFMFAVLSMAALYETSRQLERFEAYKAEFEARWGDPDK